MQDFWLYFQLGLEHITDLDGYDHILFIAALCISFGIREWKQLLLLVTAFTVGHSITLALSVLDFVFVSSNWIEFLIPITIMLTALNNIINLPKNQTTPTLQVNTRRYLLTVCFGLIHGLGFSTYLKSLLGKSSSITFELLAFNIGLEIGQLIIVICILLLASLVLLITKSNKRDWLLFVSGGIFFLSLIMALERLPF